MILNMNTITLLSSFSKFKMNTMRITNVSTALNALCVNKSEGIPKKTDPTSKQFKRYLVFVTKLDFLYHVSTYPYTLAGCEIKIVSYDKENLD